MLPCKGLSWRRTHPSGPRSGPPAERDAPPVGPLVLVIPSLLYGLRYWEAILDALEHWGVEARVITHAMPSYAHPRVELIPEGVWHARVREALWRHGVYWVHPRLARFLGSTAPTAVVSVEYGLATLWAGLAGKRWGFPVFIFHEHVRPEPRFARRLKRRWCRALASLAAGVIANTPQAAAQARECYGIPADRVRTTWVLVPPRPVGNLPEGPPSDVVFRVGFLGRLVPSKGVDTLLAAVAEAASTGAALSLSIAGDGPARPALERLAHRLGIQDFTSFAGAIPYEGIFPFLRSLDVLVLPTRGDYRAMVVLEALAAGVPVISSTADGNSISTVRDGVNGFVVSPDDPHSLADRLRRLATDRELLNQLKQGASATAIPTPDHAAIGLLGVLGLQPLSRGTNGGMVP